MATYYGDNFANTEIGTSDPDTFYMYGGNDYAYGNGGDDLIYGGDGDDYLHGGGDNDEIYGGNDNDHIYGEAGNDTLYGEGGVDVIEGGAGNDVLDGGDGDDWLYGDTETGTETGHDLLKGGAGDDRLFGGTGNDDLYGGTGSNILEGGAGYDYYYHQNTSTSLGNTTIIDNGNTNEDDVLFMVNVAGGNLGAVDGSFFGGSANDLYVFDMNDYYDNGVIDYGVIITDHYLRGADEVEYVVDGANNWYAV